MLKNTKKNKKMLDPKTDREIRNIISSTVKAATIDITCLTHDAYVFLHISSGFIAHYNLQGFIAEYGTSANLAKDILHNRENNQYTNFRPDEKNYDYYHQKGIIYNKICDAIIQFQSQSNILDGDFSDKNYLVTLTIKCSGPNIESAIHNVVNRYPFPVNECTITHKEL